MLQDWNNQVRAKEESMLLKKLLKTKNQREYREDVNRRMIALRIRKQSSLLN